MINIRTFKKLIYRFFILFLHRPHQSFRYFLFLHGRVLYTYTYQSIQKFPFVYQTLLMCVCEYVFYLFIYVHILLLYLFFFIETSSR